MSMPVPLSIHRVPLDTETLKRAAERLGHKRFDEIQLAQEIHEKDPKQENQHRARAALFAEAAALVEGMIGGTWFRLE